MDYWRLQVLKKFVCLENKNKKKRKKTKTVEEE